MSIQLYIEVDNKQVKLRTTPTQITYMCLATPEGMSYKLGGKGAKRALSCYIIWLEKSLVNFWDWKGSREDYNKLHSELREEVAHLKTLLGRGKLFKAYLL